MLSGMRPSVPRLVLSSILLLSTLVSNLAACTSTARVSDVYMALDGEGDRKRTVFFTDSKEIHCVVEMGIGRRGVTIEALIRQLQGYDFVGDSFFPTDRVVANAENSPTPGDGIQKIDVVLTARAPDGSEADGQPFPQGHFQCEAYLDGKLEDTTIFNIEFPDCPASLITPGTLCYGFYKQNLACPKYGLTSKDPAKCRCSTAKGWECD